MTCPHRGGMLPDRTQNRRLSLRFRNWNGFMRECAQTEKFRIRRKYAPGIRCLVGLFSLIFLPGILPHQEYSFSQSCEDDPYMTKIRVEMVALNATVHDGKGNLEYKAGWKLSSLRATAKVRDGKRLVAHTRAGYYAPLKSQPLPTSGQPYEDPN